MGDKTVGRWQDKSQGNFVFILMMESVAEKAAVTSHSIHSHSFLHSPEGAAPLPALASSLWADVTAVTPKLKLTTGRLGSPLSLSSPASRKPKELSVEKA